MKSAYKMGLIAATLLRGSSNFVIFSYKLQKYAKAVQEGLTSLLKYKEGLLLISAYKTGLIAATLLRGNSNFVIFPHKLQKYAIAVLEGLIPL